MTTKSTKTRKRSTSAPAPAPAPTSRGMDDAFLVKPRSNVSLAETLGEGAISSATGGGTDVGEALDREVPEEAGGPFVESTSEREIAYDTDESNPEDGTREPLPRTAGTNRQLR